MIKIEKLNEIWVSFLGSKVIVVSNLKMALGFFSQKFLKREGDSFGSFSWDSMENEGEIL